MKRKFISALLLGGLFVVSTLSLSSCKDYDDDIDSLQEQISDLSTLESSISTLESTISTLEDEIASVEDELANAADADDIAALQAEIASLEASIASTYATIDALNTALSAYATSEDLTKVEASVTEASATAATALSTAQQAYTAASSATETLTGVLTDLAAINTTLTNLQASYTSLDASVTSALYQISLLASQAKADSVFIATLYGYDPSSTYASSLEAYNAYLQSGILTELQSTLASARTTLQGNIDTLDDELTKKIEELAADVEKEITALREEILSVYGVLSKQLKSIVFSPELYYQGIEAVGVHLMNYYPITLSATADITKDQSSDEGTVSSTLTRSTPPSVASYYLNPTNATLSFEDLSIFSFIVNNATYTRSVSSDDITIKSVANSTNDDGSSVIGKIDVTFDVDGDLLSQIDDEADKSKIDVVALQISTDTIITSDFAVLKRFIYSDFALNKCALGIENNSEEHLATTAAEAIERDENHVLTAPYLTVAYNDSLDLDEYINAHYDALSDDCKLFGDYTDLGRMNFSIEYELIGWIWSDADGNTGVDSESLYGTLNDNNVFTATGVEAIGRSPLVRVTLVDGNVDQIAAVGYIVVLITDVDYMIVADPSPAEDDYYLACDGTGDDAFSNPVLTFAEFEAAVLDSLDLTVEQFNALYEVETDATTGAYVQYVLGTDGKIKTATNSTGTVTYTAPTDATTAENAVLYWRIPYADANIAFADCEAGDYYISRYIKFQAIDDNEVNRRDIYVEVRWDAEAYLSPVLTVSNDNKVRADWHASDSFTEGYDDVQLQVGNSTDINTYSCEFEHLVIANTFIEDLTTVYRSQLVKQGYVSLSSDVTAAYYFAVTDEQYHNAENVAVVGESDTEYTITVADDRLSVIATDKDDATNTAAIATIDSSTGTIDVQDNDILYDIVNGISSDRSDLVNMLTLTVNMDIDVCEEAYSYFTIENNVAEVKVLTPIYLGDGSEADLTLNQGTNLSATVYDIDLTDFNGYDPEAFYEFTGYNYTFYTFYGIESISLNPNKPIMTTYATSDWSEVNTNWFTITYTGIDFSTATFTKGEVDGGFGTVTLTQGDNMSHANGFEIEVPIVLTYKWGELHSIITVHVSPAP